MSKLNIDEAISNFKQFHKEDLEKLTYEEDFLRKYGYTKDRLNVSAERNSQLVEWLKELKAYRDLEEQGLLWRLPCKVGDTVWTRKFPTRIDEEDGTEWTICDIKRATVVPTKFNLFMLAKWGDLYFLTKEEAEQKLAEMKGNEYEHL